MGVIAEQVACASSISAAVKQSLTQDGLNIENVRVLDTKAGGHFPNLRDADAALRNEFPALQREERLAFIIESAKAADYSKLLELFGKLISRANPKDLALRSISSILGFPEKKWETTRSLRDVVSAFTYSENIVLNENVGVFKKAMRDYVQEEALSIVFLATLVIVELCELVEHLPESEVEDVDDLPHFQTRAKKPAAGRALSESETRIDRIERQLELLTKSLTVLIEQPSRFNARDRSLHEDEDEFVATHPSAKVSEGGKKVDTVKKSSIKNAGTHLSACFHIDDNESAGSSEDDSLICSRHRKEDQSRRRRR